MRTTPLADARKSTPSTTFPSALIGASSRQIRRAINVPLATAQAGESARQRRDKERLGGDDRVSVMISPYGRRRAADSEMRERSVGTDYPPSKSPSRSRSQATDHSMASARTPTPEAREPSPEPTPRRSSRLRKNDNEETPRQTKSGRSKGSVKNAAIETSAPKDSGRRRRKATNEPSSPEREAPPPVPSVPTITETAPSPSGKSNGSGYQPRAEGDLPRQQSSLRARTEKTKRAHGTSAHGSRATSPSGGGRYSAREEDLPDMEELEQTKISLPSFSGVNFGNFGLAPPAVSAPATQHAAKEKEKSDTSLSRPAAPSSSNLGVPARGPLSRLNASRPRASSPLAAGSIVAEPDSPETQRPKEPKQSLKPDENGFFSLSGSKPSAPSSAPGPLFGSTVSTDASKKPAFSFGLGKPSAPASTPVPATSTPTPPATEGGAVPDFFGRKSAPESGSATPVVAAPAPFTFGAPKPSEPVKAAASPFSFGQAATPSASDAAAAAKPAPLGSFNFGGISSEAAAKPATTDKADKAPAAIGSFNFGAPSTTPKPTTAPAASPFNFGAKPADKPAGAASTSMVSQSKLMASLLLTSSLARNLTNRLNRSRETPLPSVHHHLPRPLRLSTPRRSPSPLAPRLRPPSPRKPRLQNQRSRSAHLPRLPLLNHPKRASALARLQLLKPPRPNQLDSDSVNLPLRRRQLGTRLVALVPPNLQNQPSPPHLPVPGSPSERQPLLPVARTRRMARHLRLATPRLGLVRAAISPLLLLPPRSALELLRLGLHHRLALVLRIHSVAVRPSEQLMELLSVSVLLAMLHLRPLLDPRLPLLLQLLLLEALDSDSMRMPTTPQRLLLRSARLPPQLQARLSGSANPMPAHHLRPLHPLHPLHSLSVELLSRLRPRSALARPPSPRTAVRLLRVNHHKDIGSVVPPLGLHHLQMVDLV